jgi:methionyl-tRNA formyltransferase
LRTVFLGTSEFAAEVLGRLVGGPHRPVLVLTRPDRPSGRGRRLSPPAVALAAQDSGLELYQPESVNSEESLARIAAVEPQAVVVCAFGALVKEPLLSRYEMLNVHPSLLPRWRGAAPIERALMAGDDETGVSIMRLVAGLDSGPVCLVRSEPISGTDTYGSLADRLQRIGGDLIVEALDLMAAREAPPFVAQEESGATYAEKIEAADRLLDPAEPAPALDRRVRALYPHIGARVALGDGTLLGVQRAALADAAACESQADGGGDAGAAGAAAVREHEGHLLLCCIEGALELLEVQPPGGRPMDGASYVRGRPLPTA